MDDDGPPAEGGLAPATLVFVVRLAARAARRRQLCCTLRLWRQVAVAGEAACLQKWGLARHSTGGSGR